MYLQVQEKFLSLIFLDGFRVVPIPFVRMAQLQFLAQFPVDHIPHSVLSSPTLFLHFAYYLIGRFISITTPPTFAILFRIIIIIIIIITVNEISHQF